MILGRRNRYKGYYTVDELSVKTKNGDTVKREVVIKHDAVASIVYDTKKNKYIFVSQWRPGTNSNIIEIAAGTLDVDGEDPKDAMIREIEEELGYKTDKIQLLEDCYMSPGGSTESIKIYYSEVSEKIGEGGGLENEDIDIIEMNLNEISNTLFKDAKTIIGLSHIIKRNG